MITLSPIPSPLKGEGGAIGILGGTFDPVHFGHLRLAEEVREALGLSEVRFIPAFAPPHRDPPKAAPEHRLAMLRLALADHPAFAVDTREYARGGPSWMVDTCASLRQDFPDRPLVLILGMDAFHGFPRWRAPERILELVHLAVATRPGAEASGAAADLLTTRGVALDGLIGAAAGRIVKVPITALDIAATQLRLLAGQGRSLRYLVPEVVRHYIMEHRLYQTTFAKI